MGRLRREGKEGQGGIPTQPYIPPHQYRAPGGKQEARGLQRPAARAPGRAEGRPPASRRPANQRRVPRGRPKHRPGSLGRAKGAPKGRRRPSIEARRWRVFVVLVVVPVLLMLGSIYTHVVADDVSGRVAGLEQSRETVEVRQENLDLRLTNLTAPERIRSEASDLGLRDSVGNMKVYGSQREDGTDAAGQTGEEESR